MPISSDIAQEAKRLVAAATAKGLPLRLIGGTAIKLHSASASQRALARTYPNIDLVVAAGNGAKVGPFLAGEGYVGERAFNALNGATRQLYNDMVHKRQVNVFIGNFEMCHKLPLADRLAADPLTVPLAELFLTKAQVLKLGSKDKLDLLALLIDHEVGSGDSETINASRVASLCSKDWGLYTTVTMSLQKVGEALSKAEVQLDTRQVSLVTRRVKALTDAMEKEPKGAAWNVRARIGTRVPWYQEVE